MLLDTCDLKVRKCLVIGHQIKFPKGPYEKRHLNASVWGVGGPV